MRRPRIKTKRQWILIIVIPSILLGLMLVVAGIGKIPWLSDVVGNFPGQTEFFDVIFGPIWPTIAFFVTNIMPWVEIVLGTALLLGIYPRLAATLSLPLTISFMTSNIWAITHGEAFGSCGCFGIFEKLFGDITPLQSLGMDIALLIFAVLIIVFHPAPYLSFQSWFRKRKGEKG